MTVKVAFIGLGVMGYPMAGHLARAGHDVCVYNRTTAKAEQWQAEYAGRIGLTPAEAAKDADLVLMCVGNDNDVRAVVTGPDGVLAGMHPGAVLVDHTTTSASLADELDRLCMAQQVGFVDAPVSGGQAGAENACLTIMCGGANAVFERVQPVLDVYAKSTQLMGPVGQGQRCKMVNQICITGILQGLSEALLLAEKSGLDIEQVVETLKHGAAGSWQMENRAVTMSQDKFDFGFAIDWMRKDLGFCLEEAARHGIELPLTKEVDERYAQLQDRGLGRMDTSVLIKSLKD